MQYVGSEVTWSKIEKIESINELNFFIDKYGNPKAKDVLILASVKILAVT